MFVNGEAQCFVLPIDRCGDLDGWVSTTRIAALDLAHQPAPGVRRPEPCVLLPPQCLARSTPIVVVWPNIAWPKKPNIAWPKKRRSRALPFGMGAVNPSERAIDHLVCQAVALVAGCRPTSIRPETDLQIELGISSLGLVELTCMVQEALDLDASDVEAGTTSTVGEAVDRIRAAVARSRRTPSPADVLAAEMAMIRAFGCSDAGVDR